MVYLLLLPCEYQYCWHIISTANPCHQPYQGIPATIQRSTIFASAVLQQRSHLCYQSLDCSWNPAKDAHVNGGLLFDLNWFTLAVSSAYPTATPQNRTFLRMDKHRQPHRTDSQCRSVRSHNNNATTCDTAAAIAGANTINTNPNKHTAIAQTNLPLGNVCRFLDSLRERCPRFLWASVEPCLSTQ